MIASLTHASHSLSRAAHRCGCAVDSDMDADMDADMDVDMGVWL